MTPSSDYKIFSPAMNYENEQISRYFCNTTASQQHQSDFNIKFLSLNLLPLINMHTFIYTAGSLQSNQIICSVGGTCVVRLNNFFNRRRFKHQHESCATVSQNQAERASVL